MIEVKNLEVEQICPSPMNPRKTFDEASLEELASNIKNQGLLQPITVRPVDYMDDVVGGEIISIPIKFEIVCGERRYRACLINKMASIPCIVREMDDKEAFDAMITENLQRKDVDPIEEAFAFGLLIDNGSSAEDVALRFGKSIRFVQERLRLNALIPEMKEKVKDGTIPLSSARLLSKVSEDMQKEYLDYTESSHEYGTSSAKWFIERQFQYLDNAFWDGDDWEDETFRKCEGCEFNTGTCGCLFHEMNDERHKCTNKDCYLKKETAYILKKILSFKDELLKEGDGLIYGKAVLIDGDTPYNEDYRIVKEKLRQEILNQGILIIDSSKYFSGRCWYSEDDDRVKEGLKNHELYCAYSYFGAYGKPLEKSFYWIKKGSDDTPIVDKTTQEKETIIGQKKRNLEIATEKIHSTLRDWASTKKLYRRVGELTEDEQFALDVLLLHHCGDEYLDSVGLKKYNASRNDYLDFIKENQQRRHQWVRAFIQEELKSFNVTTSSVLQLAQEKIFMDAYKTETMKLTKKLVDDAMKKNEKLDKKLEELGFKPNGEKL